MTDAADFPTSPGIPVPSDQLHQPWRLVVAVVELLLAVAAGWAAVWCWNSAAIAVTVRTDDGTTLVSHVYEGEWIGLAFAAAAVAGVLVVDGARQTVLGVRTRRRRRRRASHQARPGDT
ncbi:hypothetical protein ACQPZU_01520 [Saccharomonospora azurea]|uniref:hypothetical protein n=1 Tax=Saccharomonospora azurea TaxID=40988 RepID=UPI003D8BDD9A